MSKHHQWPCYRVGGSEMRYSYRNWSDAFRCPVCGRERRYSLNFLGSRRVPMCSGDAIIAGPVLDYALFDARRTLANKSRSVAKERVAQ